MKNNMKNWINLLVLAYLTTACGALKHSNTKSQASVKNISAIPSIQFNTLDAQPKEWLAADGTTKFEVIGKFSNQETNNLIGADNEGIFLIGTLSLTRTTGKYNDLYEDEPFPINVEKNEDHPEIKVYLKPTDDATSTTEALISEDDYLRIQASNSTVTVQYDKQSVCKQWGILSANLPANTDCSPMSDAIECSAYGVCHAKTSCVTHYVFPGWTRDADYEPMGMPSPGPKDTNCEVKDSLPTKSTTVINVSKLTDFRINPTSGSPLKAVITFQGEQLN